MANYILENYSDIDHYDYKSEAYILNVGNYKYIYDIKNKTLHCYNKNHNFIYINMNIKKEIIETITKLIEIDILSQL